MSQIATPPISPTPAPLGTPAPSSGAGLVIDGVTYTPEMITQLRDEATRNREIAESAKVIYSKDATDPGAAEAAYRRLLTAYGWSPDDVNAEVARVYARNSTPPQSDPRRMEPAPVSTPPAAQPSPNVDPSQGRGVGVDARDAALSKEAVSHIILDNMSKTAREELLADPDFIAFKNHIASRDGDAAAAQFVESHVQQAYSSLRSTGSRRIDAEGHVRSVFGESLRQMAKEAVKDVVGKARQYLGDPKRLGKSQMAVGGEDPFSFTAKPPVPPVQYREGMPQGVLEKALDDRMSDALARSVAAMTSPNGI